MTVKRHRLSNLAAILALETSDVLHQTIDVIVIVISRFKTSFPLDPCQQKKNKQGKKTINKMCYYVLEITGSVKIKKQNSHVRGIKGNRR